MIEAQITWDLCLGILVQCLDPTMQRRLLRKVMSDANIAFSDTGRPKTLGHYKVADDSLERNPDLLEMKVQSGTVFHDAVGTEANEFLKGMLSKLKKKVPQATLKSTAEETNSQEKTVLVYAVEQRNVIMQALLDTINTLDFPPEQVEYVIDQRPALPTACRASCSACLFSNPSSIP